MLRAHSVSRGVLLAVSTLTVVTVGLLLTATIAAQEQGLESVSLGVSPQSLDLTANPSETLSNTFRVTNASADSVVMESTPKNFTPQGEEGAIDLTVDDTAFSLADWIQVEPAGAVTIAPGATQDYQVTINVPSDAEPGSHFGSVVFGTVPPEQEGSAALVSQEIAPVILVRVAGDVVETVEIAEFTTAESTVTDDNPVELVSRLENTGTVHFKPVGKISIKNMWGSQVAEFDLDQQNVLPSSIRQITSEWQPEGFQIGRYTATLTIVYGDSDEIRTAETTFMIIPVGTIVPVGAALVFLVVVFVLFRKRISLALQVLGGKSPTGQTNSSESKTSE